MRYAYHHAVLVQTVQAPGDKVTVELNTGRQRRRRQRYLASFDFGELVDQLCQIDLSYMI